MVIQLKWLVKSKHTEKEREKGKKKRSPHHFLLISYINHTIT